tara:strand:- start:31456 stop:31887 length:432 start_codon:yes stop_codon:yes gene_type:complete
MNELLFSRALFRSSELDPGDRSSWTMMAGRLGVLRKLVGVEGSWLVVQLDEVRAESRRSSPSHNCCVRRNAEAFGPGEVRGRRTLLSHARDAGLAEALVAVESVGERWACCVTAEGVSATALPVTRASASLMATVRRSWPSWS